MDVDREQHADMERLQQESRFLHSLVDAGIPGTMPQDCP
jgi:hypothetical protein